VATIDIRRWTGSLVTALDPEQQVPGDFSVLKNFIYDETGLPVVRGGRRKLNSSALQIGGTDADFQSLYHFRHGWVERRTHDKLIAYVSDGDNGYIYESTDGISWTQILDGGSISLEANLKPTWATVRGWLIFASNSTMIGPPYMWNPAQSAMIPLDGAPSISMIASHAGRLWGVDKQDTSKVYFSAIGDPTSWDPYEGSGWLYVGPGDGNNISALMPGFAGEMVIFKDGPGGGSTYRLQGLTESDFSIRSLSSTIGAISHRTCTMIGDKDIFFASRRGIHSLARVEQFGDLESKFLDTEISDRWRNLPGKEKQGAFAIDDYPHDTWWMFVDTNSDGVIDTGWLFNYRRLSPRNNPSISDMDFGASSGVVYHDARNRHSILLTGGSDGYVYSEHNPEANDDGTDFDWEMKLSPIDGGDAFAMKRWENAWIRHDNWGIGDATAEWYGDNRPPTTDTFSMNPTGAPTPHEGGVRLGEFRGAPAGWRSTSMIHLREGGVALNFKISGSRGKLRLRGMRLHMTKERDDIAPDRWFGYTKTRDGTLIK